MKKIWLYLAGICMAVVAILAAVFGKNMIKDAEHAGRVKEHERQRALRDKVVEKLRLNDSEEDTQHAKRIEGIDRDVAVMLGRDPSDEEFDALMAKYEP